MIFFFVVVVCFSSCLDKRDKSKAASNSRPELEEESRLLVTSQRVYFYRTVYLVAHFLKTEGETNPCKEIASEKTAMK